MEPNSIGAKIGLATTVTQIMGRRIEQFVQQR